MVLQSVPCHLVCYDDVWVLGAGLEVIFQASAKTTLLSAKMCGGLGTRMAVALYTLYLHK